MNSICRVCQKDLGFPLDQMLHHYCSLRCYEGGMDALAGTVSVVRDDTTHPRVVALAAWLRGRAGACRRTMYAHAVAGRIADAERALARAEAYEMTLDELGRP